MANKYYFDTCIWRDHFENRYGQSGRPLGEYATRLIHNIIRNKDQIIYADLTIKELLVHHTLEDITEMFAFLAHIELLEKTDITIQDRVLAKNLSHNTGLHEADAIHAVLAKKHQAILISQDKHFMLIKDFVQVKRPEDII